MITHHAVPLCKLYYYTDTSDIEHVTAEADDEETLVVECHFINGSDALGCLVVLVSDIKQVKNISETFYRNGSELVLLLLLFIIIIALQQYEK